MRKVFCILTLAISLLTGCSQKDRSIVIVMDNDVHCAIEGYTKLAGYRDAIIKSDTSWVATVSAGDFLQGGAIGALSDGQYVVDMMKAVGYDAVTLGNHEFDYKVPQLRNLMNQLSDDIVTCCNFYSANHDTLYYKEYVMKQMGDRKVAFIGVTTPGAMFSEAYAFVAEDGINNMFDLREADCVSLVQKAADNARAEGADYVILLAHLGDTDRGLTEVYTPTLLSKTRGIDIVLDGHTHVKVPGQKLPNIDGDSVYYMQTGTKFANIGKLVISHDGKVSSELIPLTAIADSSEVVSKVLAETNAKVEVKLQEVIGINHSPNMGVLDQNDEFKCRYDRVPLGTLVAEAFRYVTGAQIGIVNGGGVRKSLKVGQMTYGDLLEIMPFGNEVMLVSATGQQILDALETSTHMYPMLTGAFIQCAGMRYEFDPKNNPELNYDPVTNILTVNGTRRITKCEIEGPDGKYRPVIRNQHYTVASTNFVFKQGKEIMAFRPSEVLVESYSTDLDTFIKYIVEELRGQIPADYGN